LDELKYSMKALEIIDKIDSSPLEKAVEIADFYGVELEYVPYVNGLYRILDLKLRSGYFSPSMLSSYFYCARRMWLSKRYGELVDADGLKRIIRGRVAEKLWILEHEDFQEEYEIVDNELKVHGFIDALKIMNGKAILVELKTAHRVSLGHRLQTMLYKMILEKNLKVKVEAFLVYRHGVKRVDLNQGLLERYMRRVRAVLYSDIPPPPLPEAKYCGYCPYRFQCSKYPVTDWDEWLVGIVEDYPLGDKCRGCRFLYSCRRYKARNRVYPCRASQIVLEI